MLMPLTTYPVLQSAVHCTVQKRLRVKGLVRTSSRPDIAALLPIRLFRVKWWAPCIRLLQQLCLATALLHMSGLALSALVHLTPLNYPSTVPYLTPNCLV